MFCPSCGSEERQLSQFCRGCGVDLRAVRAGLERPDAVTSSAAKARDEIGRAIASKIRELEGSGELKEVAEDVLPKIEQFLESPEEKRLRRMRTGVITSSAGLGAMLMFLIVAMVTGNEEIIVAFGAAAVAFIIGLGIIINGKLLSVQRGQVSPRAPETLPHSSPDQLPEIAVAKPVELHPALPPPSVVEHTTHKLSTEPINGGRQTPIKDKN
jgi:hypothetical protein